MASLIPTAIGIGESNAQRYGGNSGFGTGQSFINALDPLNLSGKASSSVLGNLVDPGNVMGLNMGMATNPRLGGGATPSAGASGVPGVLPNLGLNPRLYDPNSFVNPAAGNGPWNQQAQQLAGPVYAPLPMPPAGLPATIPSGVASLGRMPVGVRAMYGVNTTFPFNRYIQAK